MVKDPTGDSGGLGPNCEIIVTRPHRSTHAKNKGELKVNVGAFTECTNPYAVKSVVEYLQLYKVGQWGDYLQNKNSGKAQYPLVKKFDHIYTSVACDLGEVKSIFWAAAQGTLIGMDGYTYNASFDTARYPLDCGTSEDGGGFF